MTTVEWDHDYRKMADRLGVLVLNLDEQWLISSTGNGNAAFCFSGFLVVITSVMERSFPHYFTTSFHT